MVGGESWLVVLEEMRVPVYMVAVGASVNVMGEGWRRRRGEHAC